jgi:hypothetical protein
MTTQLPYGTNQQAPDQQAPNQQALDQQAPWGSAPYQQQYGGLMVPHPELIRTAGAPKPSWGPVVAWTFFFSILGAISAARRAGRAKRAGHPAHPYWIAFGATWVSAFVLWTLVGVVALPIYLSVRHGAVAKTIASELKAEPATKGVSITAADCKALNQKGPGGLDAYSYKVTLSTGNSGAITVLADGDGAIKAVRQN